MEEPTQKEDFWCVIYLFKLFYNHYCYKTLFKKKVYSEELDKWGSVCNYGWTIENAALVCRQMGLVLNPADWKVDVPIADPSEPVLLTYITKYINIFVRFS